MAASRTKALRLSIGAVVIAGAATLAAFLPSAALATATDTGSLRAEDHSAAAAMLGGWVGGGVLLLGSGVLVASTSVRQQRRALLPIES